MSSNRKSDDEIFNRVTKLLNRDNQNGPKATEEELAERFKNVFEVAPVASQKSTSYHVPKSINSNDIEWEIERMLQESDEEDDAINEYIYGILKEPVEKQAQQNTFKDKMEGFEKAFMGSADQYSNDESDELIKRIQQENALDSKYEMFLKKKDEDLEKRYLNLKKDSPNFDGYENRKDKPKGSVPKPLLNEDFHNEMDDWCCICNDDATIECLGCEDDNKYCRECYFHTHRSESADYEATKHKSRPYSGFSK